MSGTPRAVDAAEPDRRGSAASAWLRVGVATVARTVLWAVAALLFWAAVPVLWHWQSTTVMTGSMAPRLFPGDVAVMKPVAKTPDRGLRVGQVILFDDPDHRGRLRLHRLVDVTDDGQLVTRGDANPSDDSTHVDPATVHGIAVLRVPWVAAPRLWVLEGRWLRLGVAAALAGVLLAASRLDARLQHVDAGGGPGGSRGPGGPPSRARTGPRFRRPTRRYTVRGSRPVLRAAALASAVVAVGSSALTTAAYTNTASSSGSFGASVYYTCANAITADGPGLYYKLNETSGTTATDSSGNGRNGVYRGTVTKGAARACARDAGYAVTFDGSSGYIDLATQLQTTAAFTLETWFKTTTTRGGLLVGFGSAATGASGTVDRVVYLTSTGRLVFGINNANKATVTSSASYNNGAWHHVMATAGTAGMRLYVDGASVASSSTTVAGTYNGYFRLGYDNLSGWPSAPTSNYLSGTVDEAAAYGKTLTAADAAAHNDAGS